MNLKRWFRKQFYCTRNQWTLEFYVVYNLLKRLYIVLIITLLYDIVILCSYSYFFYNKLPTCFERERKLFTLWVLRFIVYWCLLMVSTLTTHNVWTTTSGSLLLRNRLIIIRCKSLWVVTSRYSSLLNDVTGSKTVKQGVDVRAR